MARLSDDDYLSKHSLEAAITAATAQVLLAQPDDPLSALAAALKPANGHGAMEEEGGPPSPKALARRSSAGLVLPPGALAKPKTVDILAGEGSGRVETSVLARLESPTSKDLRVHASVLVPMLEHCKVELQRIAAADSTDIDGNGDEDGDGTLREEFVSILRECMVRGNDAMEAATRAVRQHQRSRPPTATLVCPRSDRTTPAERVCVRWFGEQQGARPCDHIAGQINTFGDI